MKFNKVVGKNDSAAVKKAEDALSTAFTDLSLNYTNRGSGSQLGGDPFIFQLVYPVEQVCCGELSDGKEDEPGRPRHGKEITTAATDGKRFYWNAGFVNSLSRIGLRIVIAHEAFHAIYMHPQRRSGREPWLWNIAVDYIVNYNIMSDLKSRGFDGAAVFQRELGDFIELKRYADILAGKNKPKENEKKKVFFADPNLPDDMKKPEAIYEFLYKQIPKCAKCGKPTPGQKSGNDKGDQSGNSGNSKKKGSSPGGEKGKAKKGKGQKQEQGQGEADSDQQGDQGEHGHGDGEHQCNHGHGQGPFGELMDDHLDADSTQDELAKRLADAAEITRRLAGTIPAGMQDEIGQLVAAKMRWQDVIRSKIQRVRQGSGRNDWNRFKTRQMMAGLMVPKRKEVFAKFHTLLDTSGSMSNEDMTWGISQLQCIDERGEGTITPADCSVYWDDTVKIKRASKEELSKVKVTGRGGTMFAEFINEYETRLGEADFIIIITDGYLLHEDLASMKKPKVPVYWLLTASHNFIPPFGKVLSLRND